MSLSVSDYYFILPSYLTAKQVDDEGGGTDPCVPSRGGGGVGVDDAPLLD